MRLYAHAGLTGGVDAGVWPLPGGRGPTPVGRDTRAVSIQSTLNPTDSASSSN